jgi:hypothetical protein
MRSEGPWVRFQGASCDLDRASTARCEKRVGGKLRWWLVEGTRSRDRRGRNTQTLVLELSPQFHGEADEIARLK